MPHIGIYHTYQELHIGSQHNHYWEHINQGDNYKQYYLGMDAVIIA